MSVLSLPSAARVTSSIAIASEGELVHLATPDESSWWIARVEIDASRDGRPACVRVPALSGVCEGVRREGRAVVVVWRAHGGVSQLCAARVIDDGALDATIELVGIDEPAAVDESAGAPPRT